MLASQKAGQGMRRCTCLLASLLRTRPSALLDCFLEFLPQWSQRKGKEKALMWRNLAECKTEIHDSGWLRALFDCLTKEALFPAFLHFYLILIHLNS